MTSLNWREETAAAEPWMRGTHMELDALRRGVVHALELAREDADRWTEQLDEMQFERRTGGLPSVAFHLRHTVRSLDRLLTYAEDRSLTEQQLASLSTEGQPGERAATVREFRDGISLAIARVALFKTTTMEEPRGIGRKRLPTTVGGLLVHCAEHTQRHSGQMVTTAKLEIFAAAQRPIW